MVEASALQHNWKDKISNPAQLGGIETSVLDNGAGRGSRIAWVNTGTGLRFKLVLDRAMDIADAFYNEHSLAWLSHVGITSPQPIALKGIDWIKTFGGGLLTTCGLTHVGGPESDEYGERSLHGRISNLPAEIESVIQPDPFAGKMEMSITARIRQTQVFGPSLELKRTISATLGQASIRIHDEVTNRANTPAPHMLLYHMNLGWPLVDEGADILWKGEWESREGKTARIFHDENNFRKCPPPMESHSGGGEEVAFIDIKADPSGTCKCGIHNAKLGMALAIRFQKSQLPWLTNWQHWGKGEYVTGLEPGTHPPIGQAKAREMKTLLQLEPGESKHYDLEFEVLKDEVSIKNFLQHYN
ncbi:galactose mutarotase-like enzyme [Catalinimonas alkaloidigena]|uniref:aldose 1-epimerase family protein n=1 Tax=Catalinimonas alkaloidigena TaxID=1075417 RepID=UPI0024065027|nr:aldose 1-epimerase family protein [Catalinimonas alkaloidigena]MDF9794919.1 galactose mutarotase-like enzyme [Catalinimonas alkaloidigena]